MNPHLLLLPVFALKTQQIEPLHSPAERGAGVTQDRGDVDDAPSSGKSQTRSRNPNAEVLLPGTYEIILCVDFIETTG